MEVESVKNPIHIPLWLSIDNWDWSCAYQSSGLLHLFKNWGSHGLAFMMTDRTDRRDISSCSFLKKLVAKSKKWALWTNKKVLKLSVPFFSITYFLLSGYVGVKVSGNRFPALFQSGTLHRIEHEPNVSQKTFVNDYHMVVSPFFTNLTRLLMRHQCLNKLSTVVQSDELS